MTTDYSKTACDEASLYYYDWLHFADRRTIPDHVVKHLEACQKCSADIARLQVELERLGAGEACVSEPRADQILALHFAYLSEPVTCSTARPFMPTLLEPSFCVKVPTPITVHIDHCRQCREEVAVIEGLELGRIRLARLAQLFADAAKGDSVMCFEAQDTIESIAEFRFQDIPRELLRHVHICSPCRSTLYDRRQQLQEEHRATSLKNCSDYHHLEVGTAFDLAFPHMLDSYSQMPCVGDIVSHARVCPTCSSRVQGLHAKICSILERPDSGVATEYSVDDIEAESRVESTEQYAGYPISVHVADESKSKGRLIAGVSSSLDSVWGRVSAPMAKPLMKLGASVAILVTVFAILLSSITAQATSYEEIRSALSATTNIHIRSFLPTKTESIQEQWISQPLNLYVIETNKNYVLWNFSERVKIVVNCNSGSITTDKPSAAALLAAERMTNDYFGLLPFPRLSALPENATWYSVQNTEITKSDTVEVYDLDWCMEQDVLATHKKWRVFVAPDSGLPTRTEFFQMNRSGEYELQSINTIERVETTDVESLINSILSLE